MHNTAIAIGRFAVTPLTRLTAAGDYIASVSIRNGMHDRVFRFIPRFDSDASARRYAALEGRRMVLDNQLN
ncbi:hypothetical protein [Xylophilus sp.]|uniref:hypothetical protein n=1 Tax=Xylophilus sp. TaxID=2653893 RepID=UPI002D7EA31A|nr:hypothetical protein [Xylophilus sp.]